MESARTKTPFTNGLRAAMRLSPSLLALVALIIVSSLISEYFLTSRNIANVLRQSSITGFMALGVTMAIIVGGIDLSTTGILAVSAVVGAMLVNKLGPLLTVLLCVGMGALFGLANGLIITKGKLEPFICTLGTATVCGGLALLICDGRTVIVDLPPAIKYLSNGVILGIPSPVVFMLLTYALFGIILNKTVFGRWVFAVGGNQEVARLAGVNVGLVKTIVFVLSGALSALGGVFHLSRIGVGDPIAGVGMTMTVIACAVIGGNSFAGGSGGVGLTMIGLLIMGIIGNILTLLGFSYYIQEVARGIIIVAAVLLANLRRR
ncbi:MAG: ABC transporter permease [Clostridia bacterium]